MTAELDFDNFGDLNTVEKLQVIAVIGRGPLISISENICRFQQLKVNMHIYQSLSIICF